MLLKKEILLLTEVITPSVISRVKSLLQQFNLKASCLFLALRFVKVNLTNAFNPVYVAIKAKNSSSLYIVSGQMCYSP